MQDQDKKSVSPGLAFLLRAITNLFLCFYLIGLLMCVLPSSIWQSALIPFWGPLWQGAGFWQQWALFAPDVSNFNSRIYAELIYADGSSRTYDFGQGEGHSFSGWKLRQLIHDLVPRDRTIWKDVCLFVLRQPDFRAKHTSRISLKCEIRPIAKVVGDCKSIKTFYVYEPVPGDLR